MSKNREVDRAIADYLEKVAAQLGSVSPGEKDSILREIESHIYAALEKRGGNATLQDVEAVLAEMAPPGTYGRGDSAAVPASQTTACVPREPRLCWLPIVGGALILLSFLAAAILTSTAAAMYYPAQHRALGLNSHDSEGPSAMLFASVACIGLILPAIATGLGLVGLSKIRASRGALTGAPLAVVVSLFYPLIIFNAALIGGLAALMDTLVDDGNLAMRTSLVLAVPVFLLIVACNVLTVRDVWRWANRPVGACEPT